MSPSRIIITLAGAALAFSLVACGGSKDTTPPPPDRGQVALGGRVDAGANPLAPAVEYSENDFIESERNRDPFRGFASMFAEQRGTKVVHRDSEVILSEFSISDLKLAGIVLGAEPRAMLIDPTTKGWVVRKGDYIGKPDIAHSGGSNGSDYEVYWRIDRIRDGDIVLIRIDPGQPGSQPATQVIPLHPEADSKLLPVTLKR